MKHNFLRRLSAFALALIMAAALCVSPAWAADPPESGGDGGTTTDPGTIQGLDFDRFIIAFRPGSSVTTTLSIQGGGLPDTATVDWSSNVAGVTVTPVKQDGKAMSATVSYDGNSNAKGDIKAVIKFPQAADGHLQRNLTCHVYTGTESPLQLPESTTLAAESTTTETVLVKEYAADIKDLKFASLDPSVATVDPNPVRTDDVYANTATYRVVVRGVKQGTTQIEVKSKAGYLLGSWPVTVNRAVPGTSVTRIRITPQKYTMASGVNTFQVTALVTPSFATNPDVEWSSNRPDVLTVTGTGVVDKTTGRTTATVTRVSAGTGDVTITATAKDGSGVKGECTITLAEAPSDLELEPASLSFNTDENKNPQNITATPTGLGSANATVTWTSSNSSIATVTASGVNGRTGIVTPVKAGNSPVTITATATFTVDGRTVTVRKTATVTVVDNKSTKIDRVVLSESEHSLPQDGSFTLTATVTPANAPVRTLKWDSSDESVAKVEDGKVTALSPGQTLITASALFGDGEDVCLVTVTPKAETISLAFNADSSSNNKYTYTFRSSSTTDFTVTARLTPGAPNPNPAVDPIHWSSKNTAVATVSDTTGNRAVVRAVGPGKTEITAIPMDHEGKDRENVDPAVITVTVSGVTIVNEDLAILRSLTLMENQRRQIQAQAFGSANTGDNSCDWTSSDPSVVTVNPRAGDTTTLTARGAGTAMITARKGAFTATCTVTVTEDTAGVIDGISTTPGAAYQFSKLASSISSACQAKTGAGLSYITNLSVSSTDQGILHDQHHSSSDTGAGVGIQDRYYAGTAPQGQRSLSDLSFVPRNDFSGVAEISYTAWSTNNKSVNGVIRITVNGTGDVMYASGEGSPVTFQADDFNRYHANFKSVSFTPPLDSRGVLYYNYTSASQPGTKVTASDSYNRTGTPSVDRVTFVPAAGFSGAVSISYRGTDNGGRSFTGAVTINVSAASNAGSTADISYPLREDSWVTFTPADFNAASQRTLGETLSYVRFTPPSSSDGTLFYNYRGFSSFDSMVNDTTSYYYSGAPALSGLSFVPTTTTPSQVDIAYTGYTVKGNTFTGTIHIGQSSTTQPANDLRYSVVVGQTINLSASAINSACVAATGASLNYIQFTQLPTVSQGALRYTRGSSSTRYNVSTGARFFYTGTSTTTELIGNVFFQAGAAVGTVTIPFTGYNTNGVSFTDEITIQVTPPTTSYSGTTASPLRLSASQISSAVSGALSGTLSYITFTSLPSTAAGRLYQGYNGVGTGAQVNTGTRYYASGTPSIDQISFVPRGRYNGQVTIGYTATNTSGQSTTGQVVFNISSTGNSSYFNDMYGHTWAGPSVDYLYQNNVTNGVTSTQFAPNQRINRCDFVLMLCRAFKLSGGSGYSFPDVPTGSYFASAVATAKQLGIVNGDDRGRFQPYGQVTRQDAMVMTYNALRAAGWSVDSVSTSVLNQFPDGGSVSSYARTAVSCLVQMGAVTGDNGRLLPHNSITRAEAAVILHFVMTM